MAYIPVLMLKSGSYEDKSTLLAVSAFYAAKNYPSHALKKHMRLGMSADLFTMHCVILKATV